MDHTKPCRDCGAVLPLTEFHRASNRSDGRASYCKPCHKKRNRAAEERWRQRNPEAYRERRREQAARWRAQHPDLAAKHARAARLKRLYGLSLEDFDSMLAAQGGGCAICGRTDPGAKSVGSHLRVDHCHESGQVRGLLCDVCNQAIGALGDSAVGLRRALAYLEQSA